MRSNGHLAVLGLLMLGLSACGGEGDPAKPTTDGQRILLQEHYEDGELKQYWRYAYDEGRLTEVRGYFPGEDLVSVAAVSYAAGRRSVVATSDEYGELEFTTEYAYSGARLTGSTTRTAAGAVSATRAYTFQDDRKVRTDRRAADGSLLGWYEFRYDGATGRRTGMTSYDSEGLVEFSGTRTYDTAGRLSEVQLSYPSLEVTRVFTYETGAESEEPDDYFEF